MTFFLDQTFPTFSITFININTKVHYAKKFQEIAKFLKIMQQKFNLLKGILNYIFN